MAVAGPKNNPSRVARDWSVVGSRPMVQTSRERKAAERERRRAEGLKPYEVWVPPSEWPKVKRYIERLVKRWQSWSHGADSRNR